MPVYFRLSPIRGHHQPAAQRVPSRKMDRGREQIAAHFAEKIAAKLSKGQALGALPPGLGGHWGRIFRIDPGRWGSGVGAGAGCLPDFFRGPHKRSTWASLDEVGLEV